MLIFTSGFPSELTEFLRANQIDRPAVSFGMEDGVVVGACTCIERGLAVKTCELSLFVSEPYRGRVLTKSSSLLAAAYDVLNAERDGRYADFRGATCRVINSEVSNEVMERLGFKFTHVGSSGARFFEHVFA